MRTFVAMVAFALVAAACGGASTTSDSAPPPTEAAAAETSPPSDPTNTTADDVDPPPSSTTTVSGDEGEGVDTTAPPATEPPIDGPAAPQFELALHSGDTFSLEGEQKPIYMVFWAEW